MQSKPGSGLEPRRRPSQARGRATVAAILEAAARLLRREGRAAFNTNRVAEVAGVSIGTLYGYFPDKDSLCIALARQILEDDRRALTEAIDEANAAEALDALVGVLFARHRADRALRRMVMSFYISSGFAREHDALLDDMIGAIAEKSRHLLGVGVETIDPVRLFVISRSVTGIARALTEHNDRADLPPGLLEQQAVGLIRAYLLDDSAKLSAPENMSAAAATSP